MQLAETGISDLPDSIANYTRLLISMGTNVWIRNDYKKNALDIALSRQPDMVQPLMLHMVSDGPSRLIYWIYTLKLSDESRHYECALVAHAAFKDGIISTKNTQTDMNKASIALTALQVLLSDRDKVPEFERIEQMRAIVKAGDTRLGHKKYGGFFGSTEGENLSDALAPSKEGTEMKEISQAKSAHSRI